MLSLLSTLVRLLSRVRRAALRPALQHLESGRSRCRARASAVGLLLVAAVVVAPRVSHAALHHPAGPLPVCCPPGGGGTTHAAGGGPDGFQLAATGSVSQGAIVTVQLGGANDPGLVLARDLGDGRLEGPDPTSDSATGLVPLGALPAGTSQVAWDLTLNGTPLAPGAYIVFLELFEADGRPTGIPPSPEYATLTVGDDGTVSVSMGRTVDLLAQAVASPTP